MDHPMCKMYGTKIFVRFDKYIGSGSTGTVYRGYYESENLPAAVKIMNKNQIKNLDRFKTEVETFREIKKRNEAGAEHLVSYYGMEETDDQCILAMEPCDNTLQDFIMNGIGGKPSEDELRKYVIEICRGLSIMHADANQAQMPIVHRDIKPANVLIKRKPDRTFTVKLADFGISKSLPNYHSATATAIGSNVWMSPACLAAMDRNIKYKASTKDDIFSLGILIYFVMSRGQHPFGNYSDQMSNIKNGLHRLDDAVEKNFAFQNLVRAMIQKEPEKRPTIDEVMKHPFFWIDDFSLDFVKDLSSLLSTSSAEFRDVLHKRFKFICNCSDGWKAHLCKSVQLFLAEQRQHRPRTKPYNGHNLVSLIEFIRDKFEHRSEWDRNLQNRFVFGPDSSSYMRYFREKFPALMLVLTTTEGIESLQLNPKFQLPPRNIFQLIPTNAADCSTNRALATEYDTADPFSFIPK